MPALFKNLYNPSDEGSPIDLSESFPPDEFCEEKTIRSEHTLVPFFGSRVECGRFGISDDFIEKYQSLDARFIKNKASTFFFKASGHSMEPLIFENDILIVDRSIEAFHSKVIVVAYEGSLICKRYFKEGNQVILKSENPSCKDIRVTEEMDATVWGVVTGVARELI